MKDFDIISKRPEIFKLCYYQRIDGDPTDNNRVPVSVENICKFKGNYKLLDIGCNAGMYTIIASRYCDSVIGIEPDKKYYEESFKMVEHFVAYLTEHYNIAKTAIRNMDISEYNPVVYPDAVLALNVTHQIKNESMPKVIEFLKYADDVIMMIRPNYSNMQNDYGLDRPENVKKLLEDSGKTVHIEKINMHRTLVIAKRNYPKAFDLRDYPCLLNRLINQRRKDGKLSALKIHVDALKGLKTKESMFEAMCDILFNRYGHMLHAVEHSKDLWNVYESIKNKGYSLEHSKKVESANYILDSTYNGCRDNITLWFDAESNRYELCDGSRRLASLYSLGLPIPVVIA